MFFNFSLAHSNIMKWINPKYIQTIYIMND